MPAKAGAARWPSPKGTPRRRSYRIPPEDLVRAEALERIGSGEGPSTQRGLREEVLRGLGGRRRRFALSGRRLRHILLATPGVNVQTRFAQRAGRQPLTACPVCSSPVRPIRNHTLLGDRVVLGYECARCGYWTHLKRRVPVRYAFTLGGRRREGSGAAA